MAGTVIGAALALLMLARGGSPEALPGQAVTVAFGSVKLEPFGLLRALAEGKCGPATWRQQCVELGLVGVDLGQFAATVE
jgi:hypothetical protein